MQRSHIFKKSYYYQVFGLMPSGCGGYVGNKRGEIGGMWRAA